MRMYEEYRGCESASSQITTGDGVAAIEGLEFKAGDDICAYVMQEKIEEQNDMIVLRLAIKYLTDQYVNLLTKGFDIVQWWRVNASAYPALSKLAKEIFVICCSTMASENAFSLDKRVVDPFRSSLTLQMDLEALVRTSDWYRTEQLNLYREPTKEEVELYQSCEELERGKLRMVLLQLLANQARTRA